MSGTLMLNGTNYTVTGNLMLGGGGSDANINIASEYDSTATYAYGDYSIHDGVLYRCTTAISVAEAWDSTHWTAVMVTGEYKRVRIMTKAQFDLLSADEKDGFIYVSDYPTKIQDIDNVNLTTSDSNKLLGVSVVGSDISVGAVALSSLVKSVLLTSSMTCNYADSSTIGYRSTTSDKVNITGITGYPTGKTILGVAVEYAYCGSVGEYYKIAQLNIVNNETLANSKVGGTVRFGVRVYYLDV